MLRTTRSRLQHVLRQCRSSSFFTNSDLLIRLQCNPELSADDAKAELRWMKQSLGSDPKPTLLWDLVDRRARGEPLQYILGSTDFGPLTLSCRAPTLIPRPETAHVFARLADHIRSCKSSRSDCRPLSIVDLCTGSAPIPLLLRHELGSDAQITGYDYSSDAIELARHNIEQTGLDVKVHVADIMDDKFSSRVLSDLGSRTGILVSNPPYISRSEYRQLPDSVRQWEDPAALIGHGDAGLEFYERIVKLLPDILSDEQELAASGWTSPPRVAVEIGAAQGHSVKALIKEAGMHKVEIWKDQYGQDRIVVGWA